MHFATLIPDWNSLDSVRRTHSDLEAAALVFFALLVLFDILAHLSTDDKKKTLLEKIGLCCFAIAVLAEVVAYPYGQRNDSLSAKIIGSLDAETREALIKSGTALAQSKEAETKSGDAIDKAGKAQGSLANAENEANRAQRTSSNALTLARGARQEADSFENEIVAAKKQAADIAKQLSPRTLNPADWIAIGDKIKPFSSRFIGRKVGIFSYSADAEGIAFSVEILNIFNRASIEVDPAIGRGIPVGLVDTGVHITGPIKDQDVITLLAHEIHNHADTDVYAEWKDEYKEVNVAIGVKPIPGLPKIIPSSTQTGH